MRCRVGVERFAAADSKCQARSLRHLPGDVQTSNFFLDLAHSSKNFAHFEISTEKTA